MKKSFFLILISITLFSCNQKSSYDSSSDGEAYIANDVILAPAMPLKKESLKPADQVIVNNVVDKKKIIKDGRLGIRTNDLQNSKTRTDSLVKDNRGYISSENFNNNDYESTFNLTIRIPSANFELFISQLEKGGGEILYKEIKVRDVTDQFIDLETRLKNKQNYLERYRQLLKKANTIKEILDIEEKIRVIEEEIESTTGRLKYLNDQVDYSTLDLQITKQKDFKYNPRKRDNFWERLKQSMSKGWFGFVDFMLFIMGLWPFWIVLFISIYLWRKIRKKRTHQ